jgi:hypothetical protein
MKRLHPCACVTNFVLFHSFFLADTTLISIFPGSVPSSRACALVVTSACGAHYLFRQCYISHYISGRRAACLLMKRGGTSFACRTPFRLLDTHSGELHWECFCELSPSRVVNPAHRSINHQLPPCKFPHPPSCRHTTMVGIQSPRSIFGSCVFRRHNVQPIRHNRCVRVPVPEWQTSAPPFLPPRETRRARHRTCSSKH